MRDYSLTHLSDAVLLRDLAALAARERTTTAEVLAHIAEVDARRLFGPAGFSSMHAYCVEALRLSDDAAYKRIQAARAARQFQTLFPALAEGRLHLAAVCILAPHLTADNADELIAEATHRRKSEVEELVARRFPSSDGPFLPRAMVRALPAPPRPKPELAPGQVGVRETLLFSQRAEVGEPPSAGDEARAQLAPRQLECEPADTPPPAERFLVRFTIDKATHRRLRYAQALLRHAVPSGDVAEVFGRALETLIAQLEKRKIGATVKPVARNRPGASKRLIPAHVRRAVWARDNGQCTFVSASGHRCSARELLEFDHIDPVARGGEATVERMRLRCRAHNQYEADRVFGAEFMRRKRGMRRSGERDAPTGATAPARGLSPGS